MVNDKLTVVFRIEIALLLDENGSISMEKMDRLVMLIASLQNSGIKTIVVSSGAIVLGSEKLGLSAVPENQTDKQAAAAVGQAELICCYESSFDYYNQVIAQVLLTSDIVDYPERKENARNAFNALLEMDIIPVVNENDPVSTCDIELDDNYPLALIVAEIVSADFIVVKIDSESRYMIVGDRKYPATIVDTEDGLKLDISGIRAMRGEYHTGKGSFPLSFNDIRVA